VQRRHRFVGLLFEHREMHHIHVKVQYIELRGPPFDFVQHDQMCGEVRSQYRGVEADRLIAHRDKTRFGTGIGRGEQGDLMAQLDQGVAQMCNNPFRASVQPGGHSLVQRSDLSDFHALLQRDGTTNVSAPRRLVA
jgi:hypothetical protein